MNDETVLGTAADVDVTLPGVEPAGPGTALSVEVLSPGQEDPVLFRQADVYVKARRAGAAELAAIAQAGITHLDNAIRAKIRELATAYKATDAEVGEYVKLRWLEKAETAADPREQMAALHELSQMPGTGLKRPLAESLGDRVLSDETTSVLDRLDE